MGKLSSEYSGTFRDGRPNGLGKVTSLDGAVYSGEMKDGQPHGQGTYEKPQVYRYDGAWKNGKMDGFGALESYYFNSSYVGDWVEGKREGQGTFTWNKTGPFRNGKVVYVGGFKNNKRHGAGVQTAPITGKWPRKFVNPWIYQYTGTWESGRVVGEGKAIDDLGITFEGNFSTSGFGAANLLMTLPDGRKQYGFMSIDWQYEQLFSND
jgi:hypothetical protein